jgi:hypothetical protein
MIIKIRKFANLGYVMYDGVADFDYSRYDSHCPITLNEQGDNYYDEAQCHLSQEQRLTQDQSNIIGSMEESPDKILLQLKMKNGGTKQALVHGTVFVLNDEGKTVEKF